MPPGGPAGTGMSGVLVPALIRDAGRFSNQRRIHRISMALIRRNTPKPPDAYAMVDSNSSAKFLASRASSNDSLNFRYTLVSHSFLDAMVAALVATAANAGNAISASVVRFPNISTTVPINRPVAARNPASIRARIKVAKTCVGLDMRTRPEIWRAEQQLPVVRPLHSRAVDALREKVQFALSTPARL